MSYAIFRLERLKTIQQLEGHLKHANRLTDVPNADPARNDQNTLFKEITIEALKERLSSLKRRSDSVLGYDLFFGSDNSFFNGLSEDEYRAWCDATYQFVIDVFGESNLVNFKVHRDETTPHVTACVVPERNGRLSAKSWTGPKDSLSKLQDRYYDYVKEFGLQRGLRGSKARHIRIAQFYTNINKPVPEVPTPGMKRFLIKGLYVEESAKNFHQRTQDSIQIMQDQARQNEIAQKKNRELTAHIKVLEGRVDRLNEAAHENKLLKDMVRDIVRSDVNSGHQILHAASCPA